MLSLILDSLTHYSFFSFFFFLFFKMKMPAGFLLVAEELEIVVFIKRVVFLRCGNIIIALRFHWHCPERPRYVYIVDGLMG